MPVLSESWAHRFFANIIGFHHDRGRSTLQAEQALEDYRQGNLPDVRFYRRYALDAFEQARKQASPEDQDWFSELKTLASDPVVDAAAECLRNAVREGPSRATRAAEAKRGARKKTRAQEEEDLHAHIESIMKRMSEEQNRPDALSPPRERRRARERSPKSDRPEVLPGSLMVPLPDPVNPDPVPAYVWDGVYCAAEPFCRNNWLLGLRGMQVEQIEGANHCLVLVNYDVPQILNDNIETDPFGTQLKCHLRIFPGKKGGADPDDPNTVFIGFQNRKVCFVRNLPDNTCLEVRNSILENTPRTFRHQENAASAVARYWPLHIQYNDEQWTAPLRELTAPAW